jgi:hypothetical protein
VVNPEHLHLFNPDNGESLLASDDGEGASASQASAQPQHAEQLRPVAPAA